MYKAYIFVNINHTVHLEHIPMPFPIGRRLRVRLLDEVVNEFSQNILMFLGPEFQHRHCEHVRPFAAAT